MEVSVGLRLVRLARENARDFLFTFPLVWARNFSAGRNRSRLGMPSKFSAARTPRRGASGARRAERAERGGTRCLYLLERPCSHACLELEISMRTVLLLAAAAAAAACSSCGFNCDESCNCGHCSTKPGCSSSDKCMKNCNHGGTLPVALVSRKLCCAPLSLVFARFAHASQYEFRRS